jgi:hypothetical protein
MDERMDIYRSNKLRALRVRAAKTGRLILKSV